MRWLLSSSLIVGLLAFSIVAKGAPEGGIDYSNCSPQQMGYPGGNLFKIGSKGDFDAEFKAKADSTLRSEDGLSEEVAFRYAGYNGMGTNSGSKVKYTLTKKDGRPFSVETQWDYNVKKTKIGGMKSLPMFTAGGVRFGIEGNKCFVAQEYYKLSDGKEIVSFDNALCNEILTSAKKFNASKIMECSNIFAELDGAIAKASMRINECKNPERCKESKDLKREFQAGGMGGFGGFGMGMGGGMGNWASINMIGLCNMTRAKYGLPVDPKAEFKFGMGYTGGFGKYPGVVNDQQQDKSKTEPAN